MNSSPSQLFAVARDHGSAAFFDAANESRFVIKHCSACGEYRAPEVGICSVCGADECALADANGTGHVVSWIVTHSRAGADGVVPSPRVIVTVEFDEGPWFVGELVGSDAVVAEGLRVRVAFHRPENSESIPYFVPA